MTDGDGLPTQSFTCEQDNQSKDNFAKNKKEKENINNN
jgi:hypothetical protein